VLQQSSMTHADANEQARAAAMSETDGDSSLGNVTITGVPDGVTFNKGTLSNGTLTVSPTDLATLQLTVPDSDQGNFTLTVTATASDGSDSASTSGTITVTVNPKAEAPSLTLHAAILSRAARVTSTGESRLAR